MTTAFEAALWNVATATLIAGVVYGVTRVWRNPHVGHLLWVLVLAKFLVPPVVHLPCPSLAEFGSRLFPSAFGVAMRTARFVEAPSATTLRSSGIPGFRLGEGRGEGERMGTKAPSPIPLPEGEGFSTATTDPNSRNVRRGIGDTIRWQTIWPWAFAIWVAGSVGYFAVVLVRIIRFGRMIDGALPASGELRQRVNSLGRSLGLRRTPTTRLAEANLPPFVWSKGLQPVLVLPRELVHRLNSAELDTIILHELAHVRRYDYLVRWLELLVTALHWWNPVIWLVRRELRQAEELCCDAWVAEVSPNTIRQYAGSLLRVAEWVFEPPTVPLVASGLSHARYLERRITMVLSAFRYRRLSTLQVMALVASFAVVLPVSVYSSATEEENDTANAAVFAEPPQQQGPSDVTIPANSVRAICTMDRDGTNFDVIVKEPAPEMVWNGSPRWSYDGRMVAFDSTTADGDWSQSRIFVVAVSGPFKGKVKDLGFGVIPSWSPDDRQIVFQLNSRNPDNAPAGIWVVNSDGTGREYLGEGCMPHWSPRGDLIACTDRFGPSRNIYLIDLTTGERTPLFQAEKHTTKSRLAWAPDGDRLAFAPADLDAKNLFLLVNVRKIPPTPAGFGTIPQGGNYPDNWGYPAWSPDGKQMVFQMFPGRGGNPTLYSMSAEVPSAPIRLGDPKVGTKHGFASWSPDSKRIVLSCILPSDYGE